MYKVIVIDDEKPARDMIKGLLKINFAEFEVIAEANSVTTGIDLLKNTSVDLVFLDINLSDGSGFNILEKLDQINFHVIFVTAYNNFAVKAFRINALDYILKPISVSDLGEAILKFKNSVAPINKIEFSKIQSGWDAPENSDKKLAIRELDGVSFVKINEIIRCKSHSNYTEIFATNDVRIMTTRTLKEYTVILQDYGFFRIHQSHLVNLKHIKKIIKKDGHSVQMENGDILDLSRRKKDALFEQMEKFQI